MKDKREIKITNDLISKSVRIVNFANCLLLSVDFALAISGSKLVTLLLVINGFLAFHAFYLKGLDYQFFEDETFDQQSRKLSWSSLAVLVAFLGLAAVHFLSTNVLDILWYAVWALLANVCFFSIVIQLIKHISDRKINALEYDFHFEDW